MAWNYHWLRELLPILEKIPEGVYFDIALDGDKRRVSFQAATQEEARAIRVAFPGAVWKKEWEECGQWWAYSAQVGGFAVKIYAVREGPPTCTAITEEREVEERIPVAFETRLVRKTVIVGWDCVPGVAGDVGDRLLQSSKEGEQHAR